MSEDDDYINITNIDGEWLLKNLKIYKGILRLKIKTASQ